MKILNLASQLLKDSPWIIITFTSLLITAGALWIIYLLVTKA